MKMVCSNCRSMSMEFNLNDKGAKSILRNNAPHRNNIEHYIIIQECGIPFHGPYFTFGSKNFFPIVQVTIYCDEQPIKRFECFCLLNINVGIGFVII